MAKYIQTYDELYQIAQKNNTEMLKDAASTVEILEGLAPKINIASFAEKNYFSLEPEGYGQIHSDLYQNERRLQHINESPRKKVAEIIIQKCQECYDKRLQTSAEALTFVELTRMLGSKEYTCPEDVRKKCNHKNAENRFRSEVNLEKLKIYTSLMNSFFTTDAIISENVDQAYVVENQKDADKHQPVIDHANAEVFQEIADALPDGPEYEPYKALAGYANQQPLKVFATHAVLEIGPNGFTDITPENYSARIHTANPNPIDLQWGASSFDNMIASLYNQKDIKTLKNSNHSFLDTVLIDGLPATAYILEKADEPRDKYEQRMKAEITAYILNGNRKVEITPYDLSTGTVAITEPIPAIVSPGKNSVINDVYLSTVHLKTEPAPSLNIKANTYASMIRTAKPNQEHLAWGANAFDNMMKDVYTKEELETLNNRKYSLVNTIFIDGKPANEVIAPKRGEFPAQYEERAKAEIVAYALEAEKHIHIAPYNVSFDKISLKGAIPVKPIINLEDDTKNYSSWKKFQNFVGLHVTSKDKAEKLSSNSLESKNKADMVTKHVLETTKRTNETDAMKREQKRAEQIGIHNDEAFLGSLINRSTLKEGESISDRLNGSFEHIISSNTTALLKTLHRQETRSSLIGLYALSKGMTLDEILSTDPKYDARKQEIGAEFADKISVMGQDTFNALQRLKGGTTSYETYVRDKQQMVTQMYADLNQTLLNQPVDFLKDCSLENVTANYTKINFLAQAALNVDQCFLEELKNLDSKEVQTLSDKTLCTEFAMEAIRNYCNYIASEDYAFPACDRTNDKERISSQKNISNGVLGRLGIEKLTRDLSSFNSTEPLTVDRAFQNFDRTWISNTGELKGKIISELEPSTLLNYSEYAATGKNASITYDEVSKTYITNTPKTIEAINKNNSPAAAKELMSFEELTFDQAGKKLVPTAEIEREKESSAMKQSLNHNKQITAHNEDAFFGFITEESVLEPGETKSQRLNKVFCKIISSDPSNEHATLLRTMYRSETRTNLVGLYALSKGMPLEEILSSDPKYDERKREIGTEFVDKIALMKPDAFNSINRTLGRTTSYEEYIQNKKQMISQMYVDLNKTLLDQSVDFLKDNSLENLTANYTKLEFLAQAACNADQCFNKEDKKLDLELNKQLTDKNLDAQLSLKTVRDYCEFIASDEYADPDLGRTKDSQVQITAGIIGRLAFEKLAAESSTEPLTIERLTHDLDHTWNKEVQNLQWTLLGNGNGMDQRTFKDHAEYLTTGKNARLTYDEVSKKFLFDSPETIAAIKKNNSNLGKKEWMSFEELSFDQTTNKLVSKQTPSKQQNNPTIQKGK